WDDGRLLQSRLAGEGDGDLLVLTRADGSLNLRGEPLVKHGTSTFHPEGLLAGQCQVDAVLLPAIQRRESISAFLAWGMAGNLRPGEGPGRKAIAPVDEQTDSAVDLRSMLATFGKPKKRRKPRTRPKAPDRYLTHEQRLAMRTSKRWLAGYPALVAEC